MRLLLETSMKTKSKVLILLVITLCHFQVIAQRASITFTVRMENPEWHFFQVQLSCKGVKKDYIDFKIPVWTPGYYQKMEYGENILRLRASDTKGNSIKSEQIDDNTWRVFSNNSSQFDLTYEVKTERAFVASPFLDENRAYILPAGVFLYIDKMINIPAQVVVVPDKKWNRVATGLDSLPGKKFTYSAPDFDILYDSPILAGNLEELPAFKVNGVTHRFIGYKLGEFDKKKFMLDLKKIVETSVKLFGHIPYKHFTFIAIGPGQGGIEHLNSTTISFDGNNLNRKENYIRTMYFLAHEFFHTYNVKRIRPVELGPFDYNNGNKTKMLWFSEGFSVYYEYLIVKRAGLTNEKELLASLQKNMFAFENKPGRLYQTLEEASYETWNNGPFGNTGEDVNKTISYYEKGPVVGLLFDFKIRQLTANKRSLDDLMRFLYTEFYQKKKKGFTDAELINAFEKIAGAAMEDEYRYVKTTTEPDYPTYFQYAGLSIDTTIKSYPGAYTGLSAKVIDDTLIVNNVDYTSPAWDAGMRKGTRIIEIDKEKATDKLLENKIKNADPGETLKLTILDGNGIKNAAFEFGVKKEKSFEISRLNDPTPLQKQILESWLKG